MKEAFEAFLKTVPSSDSAEASAELLAKVLDAVESIDKRLAALEAKAGIGA